MKAFALLTIFACLTAHAASDTEKPRVLLQELKTQPDLKRVVVPAKVQAKVQSLVTADIEGHVTRVLKPLGSTVKAGETILFLENKDPGFTYAAVPVRSPISGVLSQLWPAEMAKVTRGDKLFTVINAKSLRVSAEIPGSDLSLVKSGTVGQFSAEMPDGTDLKVRVIGVSPLVDPRTGTAPAELEFVDAARMPPIGTIGKVVFEMSQGDIMLVPESAVSWKEGKPRLRFLKKDGSTEKKPVELGEQRESLFVLKSGSKAGEKVVVRASRPIKDGEMVEIEGAPKTQ